MRSGSEGTRPSSSFFSRCVRSTKRMATARHRHREHQPLGQHLRRAAAARRGHRVHRVRDAQPARHQIAHHRGHQRGQQRLVAQAADDDDLQPEHRARDGRAEHRAEAARDARGEQLAPRVRATLGSGAAMASARLPPICTAVPSRPALPPKRCVSTVPTSTMGAMRSGSCRSPSCTVSMTRLLPPRMGAPHRAYSAPMTSPASGSVYTRSGALLAQGGGLVQQGEEERRCHAAHSSHEAAQQEPLSQRASAPGEVHGAQCRRSVARTGKDEDSTSPGPPTGRLSRERQLPALGR